MNAPIASRSARRFPILLLALLAWATALRWSVIDRDALWLDEGYSWWDARQPLHALWTLVPTCDPHPPLYFAVLHGWIASFGDGTVPMRSLSTILGVATVAFVYFAGRQIDAARGRGDKRFGVGFLAALLFAMTPFQVYFSVEARPYALLCFGAALLTLGCLLTLRAIATAPRRNAPTWWHRIGPGAALALLAGSVIAVWTNNTAVLVLGAVAIGFVALWTFDVASRSTIVPVVVIGILVGVLWAPDWPLLLAQKREITEDFWISKPSFDALTYELHWLVGLDSLRAPWWVLLAVVGGLLAVGRAAGWRWAAMLASLALLPIVLNVVVSAVMSPILLARALIGAAPALAIALAAAAILLRPRALRVAVAVALIVVHGIALEAYLGADHVKEPWKPIVARLAVEAQGGPILVVPNELVLPLTHEAERQGVDLKVSGVPADYPAIDMPGRYPSGKCAPSAADRDLGPIVEGLHDAPNLVLLTRLHNTYDPQEDVAAALTRGGYALKTDDVFQPGDLRVMRFARETR